jgi:hypothetical protein
VRIGIQVRLQGEPGACDHECGECLSGLRINRWVVLAHMYSQAFWDSEDGVAMGDVFDNFAVDVFCELHRSLSSARGAYPTALARKRDQERVLASITVYPCGTVREDSAVKVFVEGLQYLIRTQPL